MTRLERLGLEVSAYTLLGSRSQAAMLCALIDAHGAVMSWSEIASVRPWRHRSDDVSANVIKTRACRLRESMDDVGLGGLHKTARRNEHLAYSLPEPGRTVVLDRLIAEAASC